MGRAAAITAAVVVSAVALVLAAVGDPDARDGSEPSLGSRLDDVVAQGVPGALAFVVDGSRRVRLARGVANRETGAELHATDRFRAGSITKTFVAAVVLQLAAEGRLELDSRVGSWLPGLVDRRITVRQLLSHRSGLADYVDDRTVVSGDFSGTRRLVEAALARSPVAPPGERYCTRARTTSSSACSSSGSPGTTSSTSFERGSSGRWAWTTRASSRASRSSGCGATGRRSTTGSSAVSPRTRAVNRRPGARSAGAVVSDADDLARFLDGLVTGRVVPEPLLAEMIPAQGYGLGLAAFTTPCGTAIGHSGNVSGYVSVAWVDREAKRTVVLMANSGVPARAGGRRGSPPRARRRILRRRRLTGSCGTPRLQRVSIRGADTA